MYKFTRDFLEYLADKLQIGDRAPNYDFRLYKREDDKEDKEKDKNKKQIKKDNNKDKDKDKEDKNKIPEMGKFKNEPVRFGKDIDSIEIDRRIDMSADEASIRINNVNGIYSPDYSTKKVFTGVDSLDRSGYHYAIMPYNRIEIDLGYGPELIPVFSGQIQDVDINENFPTISITAKNELRKLLKPIDPIYSRKLIYKNKRALEIVLDLCKRANVSKVSFDIDEVKEYDYGIEKAEFELGMFYKDAVDSILSTMGHRIYADRFGAIRIIKLEEYDQKDMEHWIFDDYVDLSQGNYRFDSSVIRNRFIIQSKNSWKAFEDPLLLEMTNGERISMGIEVPWAETDKQKKMVADNLAIQMRRKLRRVTVATIGNPTMDVGDLVKLKMLTSTANDRYMITGIKSSFSSSGYIDIVDLEFVGKEKKITVEAIGDYDPPKVDIPKAPTAKYGLRDQIVDEARRWLGTYYQWGGDKVHNKNHYGFDCSHFTFVVYKKFGLMDYYRTAANQHRWAVKVSYNNLKKGDLVFYTNSRGRVGHVGIFIGNGKVISASGGGSSTTTIGRARQRNAKVKVHNIHYRRGPFYYGRAPRM